MQYIKRNERQIERDRDREIERERAIKIVYETNFDAKFACLNFDPLLNPARTSTT